MNPAPRSLTDEDEKLIKEYLKNGGEVDVRPAGERSEEIEFTGGFYQKRKKKAEEEKGKNTE